MTTAADIIAAVRVELNDTDPNNYRWSDEELLRYVNAAQRQIVVARPEARVGNAAVPAIEEVRFKIPERGTKFLRAWNRGIVPTSEFVTSKPYPYEYSEAFTSSLQLLYGQFPPGHVEEVMLTGVQVTGGELRSIFQEYTNWPEEEFTLTGVQVTGGELRSIFQEYTNWPEEEFTLTGVQVTGGTLEQVLQEYTSWPEEEFTLTGVQVIGGSLE